MAMVGDGGIDGDSGFGERGGKQVVLAVLAVAKIIVGGDGGDSLGVEVVVVVAVLREVLSGWWWW